MGGSESRPLSSTMSGDSPVPPFFEGFMVFLVVVYGFEAYLDVRQRRKLLEKTVPAALSGVVTQQEFESARSYSLDKNGLTMLQECVNTTATGLFYLMGGLPWLWECAGGVLDACGVAREGAEMAHSLAFVTLYYIQATVQGIPWDLYETFVIEERHGFNKQTMRLFITDQLKTHALFALLGTPALAGLLSVIKWGGPLFYVYAWALVFVLLMFFLTIYPNVIAPMFNKFTPLEEGPLKSAIDELAKLNKFPLKKLYCVDGSTRSSHSNAYFYGFGSNKRIVLYDTLCPELLAVEKEGGEKEEKTLEEKEREKASSCTIEEIVAILAHELGHWKMSHTLCQLAVSQVHVFFFFFSLGYMLNTDGMYRSWGFKDERAVIIGLILFSNVVSPVEHVIGFLQNCLTRRFEYQADNFAVQQGRGDALCKGLVKISKGNKSNLNPDWMHSAYHHTHPALLERLNAISQALKKRK